MHASRVQSRQWTCKASATAAMNRLMRGLHSEGVWIPRCRAQNMMRDGMHFIRVYLYLAREALSNRTCLYALYPKLHMLHHLFEEMHHQCAKSAWTWNPLVDACFIEEDFVGRISALSRCVSARAHALRSLQRHLVQLNVCFSMR